MTDAHVIVGVERLPSVLYWRSTRHNAFGDRGTRKGTNVSLLGAGGASNPFSSPRLAVDAMLGAHFTLGGALGYYSGVGDETIEFPDKSSSDPNSPTPLQKFAGDLPSTRIFVVAPRFGYLWPATGRLSLWARAGITYVSARTKVETESYVSAVPTAVTEKLSFLDLTLEPELVFALAPHVALTLGAALDLGLTGSAKRDFVYPGLGPSSDERDASASSFGAAFGMVAIF